MFGKKKIKQIDSKKVAIAILLLVFFAKLALIIWQFVHGKYIIAPGGDPVHHLAIIQTILEGTFSWHNISYPPLYHFIIALIVKCTGQDILQIMKYGAITLLFVNIPIFYFFAKYLFGFWAAFWATLLLMLVSLNPTLNFVDGSYPDLLNYGVFIPLAFLFLLKSFERKPLVNLGISLFFIILMVFTHNMTTAFALLIIAVYLCVIGIYYYFSKNKELKNYKVISLFFLASGLIIYFLARISFGPVLDAFIKSLFGVSSFMTNTTFSDPPALNNLYSLMPLMFEFFGFIGLIYCFVTVKNQSYKKIFIIVWVIVLWILSRTDKSGVAPRFLRELSYPLIILSGITLAEIIKLAKNSTQKIVISGAIGYLIFINLFQIFMPPFQLPGGFGFMVWYTHADQEKVDYITSSLPEKSSIISNSSSPYLPYFFKKKDSGKEIKYKVLTNVPEINKKLSVGDQQNEIKDYLKKSSADYMLIGSVPMDKVDETTFSEFNGYNKVTDLMNRYQYSSDNLIKEFSDGSKLIKINR